MPIGSRASQHLAITGTSANFTTPMSPGVQYMFTANVNCWVKVTTSGGAAAADTADNILYITGMQLPLKSPDDGTTTTNSYVHVISDGTNGDGCLRVLEGA